MTDVYKRIQIDPSGCWIWRGYQNQQTGYCRVKYGNRYYPAHRFVYWKLRGSLPPAGQRACHTCDVRNCVNPDHIFFGTPKQNSEDMVRKGRSAKGSRCGKSKLNESKVIEIKLMLSNGEPQLRIARAFFVDQATISNIATNETWTHV